MPVGTQLAGRVRQTPNFSTGEAEELSNGVNFTLACANQYDGSLLTPRDIRDIRDTRIFSR
jgi:hypothetical protein